MGDEGGFEDARSLHQLGLRALSVVDGASASAWLVWWRVGRQEEVRVLSKFRHPNLVILMGFARHGSDCSEASGIAGTLPTGAGPSGSLSTSI